MISLAGSDLAYKPGDALGVFPENCPELVDELLRVLGADGPPRPPRGTDP